MSSQSKLRIIVSSQLLMRRLSRSSMAHPISKRKLRMLLKRRKERMRR
jgi:hypothetical protein